MTTSQPAAPGVDLGFLLTRATHALHTEHTAALAEIGITPRTYCVLSKALDGEHTQIQLAELSGLDKTTMVVTIDELEAAGLAERRPSPTDRRARIISVTEAGQQKVAEGARIVARVHDDVLAALPSSEREGFVNGLVRLAEGRLANPVHCEPPVRRRREPAHVT